MSMFRHLREALARRARTMPVLTSGLARYRRRKYERGIEQFLVAKDGHAGKVFPDQSNIIAALSIEILAAGATVHIKTKGEL